MIGHMAGIKANKRSDFLALYFGCHAFFQNTALFEFDNHQIQKALQEFAPKFIILMVMAHTHNHLHIVVRYNFFSKSINFYRFTFSLST